MDALGWSVGHADTGDREPSRKASIGSAAPANRLPSGTFKHCLCRYRLHVWHMALAGAAASCDREDHGNVVRVDLLLIGDAQGPCEAAFAQALPEGRGKAVSCVSKDTTEAGTGSADPVDLGQRDLGLGPVVTTILRHAGGIETGLVADRTLGQEQP